jgi:hypothetical protein
LKKQESPGFSRGEQVNELTITADEANSLIDWLEQPAADEPVDLAAALKASVEAAHQRRIEAMGDAS